MAGVKIAERITLLLAMVLLAAPACAQSLPGEQAPAVAPERLFSDNLGSRSSGQDRWRLGARLSLEMSFRSDTDLDPDVPGGEQSRLQPEARFYARYQPNEDIEVFALGEAGYDIERRNGEESRIERLEVRELYVLIDDFFARHYELQIGRQDVEDGREWLYDARLDGVRLAYDHRAWRLEAMMGREAWLRTDLLHDDPDRDKVNVWLMRAEYEINRDWDSAAYLIKQDDRQSSELNPLTFGLQSEGRSGPLGHWLELAGQRGTSRARDLEAWAVDAGLIWYFDGPLRPALFAGYARGSGGGNDRIDRRFRQTGLQDDEDRITGLGNVRYYGESLDPELSNLEVGMVGMGFRPSPATSFELIAHHYRQVVADDSDVPGSPVSAELDGEHRDIGDEIDIVFSGALTPRLGVEAKIGWFMPGSGYDAAAENAMLTKVRFVYRF